MFKILFIDEERDTLDDFEDYVEGSTTSELLEVVTVFPLGIEAEMIDEIININPDAIITDFRLNESKDDITYNIPYNGVDLINSFRGIRNNFPCFVLTSVDDEAVSQSEDVNLVYIKNLMHSQGEHAAKANFLDRVISQIKHYKSKISNAEVELLELIALRDSGGAKIQDENRIIDLDHFLEKSIDKRSAIPIQYKSLSNAQQLSDIFDKVDELIKTVGQSNGN